MDSKPDKRCYVCGIKQEDSRFVSARTICIFCEIDAAEKVLSKIQDKLNFAPPNNGPLKRNCKRCKAFVWWVNLNDAGRCAPCEDDIAAIAKTPVSSKTEGLDINIDDILETILNEGEL